MQFLSKPSRICFTSVLLGFVYFVLWAFFLSPAVSISQEIDTERQNWQIFTSGNFIQALLLSDDSNTLWVGTNGGGLEKRDALTGELQERFINQNGLPGNVIWSMLSDGNGGVWVGTNEGLAHFHGDGTLEVFDINNSGLPANLVLALAADHDGGIWVATDSGFAHMTAEKEWEVFNSENSPLPGYGDRVRVNALLLDEEGGIWAGTWSGLAHLQHDGIWQIFQAEDMGYTDTPMFLPNPIYTRSSPIYTRTNRTSYLPDIDIASLLSDSQGGIWVGSNNENGLFHLKSEGTWEIFNSVNSGIPDDNIYTLLSDGNGGIWMGTLRSGLVHMTEKGDLKFFNEENSPLTDNWITAITADSRGGIWVGTKRGLFHYQSDGTWNTPDTMLSQLPGNWIADLLWDYRGGIWVGMDDFGLAHFKGDNTWEFLNSGNSGLIDDNISSLATDAYDGENLGIWVGYYGGLAHFDLEEESWTVFDSTNSGLLGIVPLSLLGDLYGGVWVGTYEGITHLKPDGEYDIFHSENSDLPHNNVFHLLSDGNDGIWAATRDGLAHLEHNGAWEVFRTYNSGISDNWINTLHMDQDGGIWAGAEGSGLSYLKSDGEWQNFDDENSGLPDNWVSAFSTGYSNGLWVGTNKGLAHFGNDGLWSVYDQTNSHIPDNHVRHLLPDLSGGIWIGTLNGGLSHLILTGVPVQIATTDSPDIKMEWFLNSAPVDYQNVKYVELQRALSRTSPFETVNDTSGNPVRFDVDYTHCPNPRVDQCWPTVKGHTPAYKEEGDLQIKGYTLDLPVTDPEWLEGVPRYFRLSAVIEEDGRFIRVADNNEASLMTPAVEEYPRIELSLERYAIAILPGSSTDITLFVSSLDLFTGEVEIATSIISDMSEISNLQDSIQIQLSPRTLTLSPGEIASVLLHIEISPEVTHSTASIIQIIPKNQYNNTPFKSTSLTVYTGTEPMAALSIAHTARRPRVLDGVTLSGNIVPSQSGQEVIITGKNAISGNEIELLTLVTDEKGFFEGTIFPENAGTLVLTARSLPTFQSDGVTSNSPEIFILPAKNQIGLTSNVDMATSKKDNLVIEGMITPVRPSDTKTNSGTESGFVNLDIRFLDPASTQSDPQVQFVGIVDVDEDGKFTKNIVVPGDGFINVKASLPETSDFLGIETKLVIPIGQPVGEGIIVVSESGDPEFQEISKSLGKYVYNTLKTRNIPKERIRYLGLYDESDHSDELFVPDASADKINLHHAITEWAVSLISTDDPYQTPLNLYLIGDVEEGSFRLNANELLSAEELNSYLDEAESLLSGDNVSDNKGFPVTIVLEGSQSEKWIEQIAGKGRIILTSSSSKSLDQGGYAGYDSLGESSFSRYFYQFINYGSDIEGSFAEANYEILKFYRHTQRPVMDADGDGVGTTKYDRYEASGKYIEYRPSGNLRPEVRATNPDMTVNRKDGSTLWAIATDPETEIQGVFCSITGHNGDNTLNIDMQHDRGDMYLAEFNPVKLGFPLGLHQLVYYAKDKSGNVSLPVEKFINVVSGESVPGDNLPDAPEMSITIKETLVTISWSDVEGADSYTLFYAPYPNAEYIGEIDVGVERSITFDGAGMAFYGAIKACNDMGCSSFSNIEWFDLK
ncbi:exported hypothetical protein [Desulfamplus magnetovallimortis]|uniref:Uncharacterized protein n=1 Tax=Desulfamplus magnetovallimortis TaxID=1246637 RepID=A0A1W1HEB9_9BACT|nr:two-component regulator propeller domain-containing protein [Desulfamplus magnetovallimortis]SLM30810.1 exported hypothetical protein [Desulfamplus magnetovallimortis]